MSFMLTARILKVASVWQWVILMVMASVRLLPARARAEDRRLEYLIAMVELRFSLDFLRLMRLYIVMVLALQRLILMATIKMKLWWHLAMAPSPRLEYLIFEGRWLAILRWMILVAHEGLMLLRLILMVMVLMRF